MLRSFTAAVFAALVSLNAVPASAAVRYSFTALSSFEGISGSFEYTSPTFIADNRFTPVAAFDACTVVTPVGGACTNGSHLFADTSPLTDGQGDLFDSVAFSVNNTNPEYYFADGAFSAVGTYQTVEFGSAQAGTLTVSQVGGVPEPATWALMIGGFGLVGTAARRRRRFAEPA